MSLPGLPMVCCVSHFRLSLCCRECMLQVWQRLMLGTQAAECGVGSVPCQYKLRGGCLHRLTSSKKRRPACVESRAEVWCCLRSSPEALPWSSRVGQQRGPERGAISDQCSLRRACCQSAGGSCTAPEAGSLTSHQTTSSSPRQPSLSQPGQQQPPSAAGEAAPFVDWRSAGHADLRTAGEQG